MGLLGSLRLEVSGSYLPRALRAVIRNRGDGPEAFEVPGPPKCPKNGQGPFFWSFQQLRCPATQETFFPKLVGPEL